jgi:hypothetical protein
MARKATMMPMTSGGSGTGRRLLAALVALVLVALVLRDPVGAAHTVQRLASWASDVVDAISTFGSALSRTS